MDGNDPQIARLLGAELDGRGENLRVQRLGSLADAAPVALADLGAERALPIVCAALLRAMACTTAVVSMLDAGRRTLVSATVIDASGVETRAGGERAIAGDRTIERVLGECTPLFAAAGERAAERTLATPLVEPGGSLLVLPLVWHGASVGVIELAAGVGERRYTAAEMALAQGVCETVAVAASEVLASEVLAGGLTPATATSPAPVTTSDEATEFSRTLGALARRLCEGLAVSHCDILVRESVAGTLRVVAHHGESAESSPAALKGRDYGLGETGTRAQAVDQRAIVQARDDDIALAADERAEMAARGERSVMYVPVVSGEEVVGLLSAVESRVARRFTPAEEAFAAQMAWEAAVAVNSARVVERLSGQNRELSLLLETGAAIAASVDLRETLSTISERLVKTLGVAWGNVYDHLPETGELEVIAYYQIPGVPTDPNWIGQRFGVEKWPEGVRCVVSGTPQTKYYDYAQLSPDDFAFMEPWGEKATLSVPLIYGDEVLGVLDVAESRYPRRFSDDEVRLAQAIANQAAVAIRNARLYAEATDRNAELATVLGVAEALSSTFELDEVLLSVSWRLREALGSDSVEIYEYEATTRRLCNVAHAASSDFWLEDPEWTGVYDLADNEMMCRCIDGRETLIVRVDDESVPELTRQDMRRWGDASELWIPMVFKDEVLGMVSTVEVAPHRRYATNEIRLAQAIAAQGAVAIANARAYQSIRDERARLAELNRRLTAFAEVSGQLRGLVGEEELLGLVGRVLSEALGFGQWVAYLRNAEAREFRVVASVGASAEIDEHYRSTPVPAAIIAGLLADATPIGQSFFIDHLVHTWTDEENRYLPGSVEGERADDEWNNEDTLFVPMLDSGGGLLGYLEAYDPVDRARPDEDLVRLLEIFAAKAAAAIDLQRAYAQLELQSRSDGLTGLFNHGYFQERLRQELRRAARTRRALTVLMIDVDDFKEFNDTYGHPQGDRLLKRLAALLVEQTRIDVDFVARYGGEEFVVLLPETTLGGAEQAAERLQEQLGAPRTAEAVAEAIRAVTEEQALADVSPGLGASVTVSVGVATFPDHGSTPDQLVANADKALYMAKRQGKNRVCVYQP